MTRLCTFVICFVRSLDVHQFCEMIWQNSTYKAIDILKSPFVSFTIRIIVNSVHLAIFVFIFFVQVYCSGALISTLSLPFTPGGYTVSGLDPETRYKFAGKLLPQCPMQLAGADHPLMPMLLLQWVCQCVEQN